MSTNIWRRRINVTSSSEVLSYRNRLGSQMALSNANPCIDRCSPRGNVRVHIRIKTVCTCKCEKALWQRGTRIHTARSIAPMQILWMTSALPPLSPAARGKTWGQRCSRGLTFNPLCTARFLIFCPLTAYFLPSSPEHKEGAEWRKAVPSYTQSSSTMDFRTWSSLPRDDSLEPLPLNWEMAYTETGMVYFIE